MMRVLSRWGLALAFGASGAALTPTHSESQRLDARDARVKLTGTELRRFATEAAVYAGVHHQTGCAFRLAVYAGGDRELFWTCGGQSGTWGPGTAYITWDEVCTQYRWLDAGEPTCWQYYQIGPHKYESYRDGQHVATFTKVK